MLKTTKYSKIHDLPLPEPQCLVRPKKCHSGQRLNDVNKCLPVCNSKSTTQCTGRYTDDCHNDKHCFNNYFNWSCESLITRFPQSHKPTTWK